MCLLTKFYFLYKIDLIPYLFCTIILFSLALIGFVLLMKLQKYLKRKSRKIVVFLENETLINQK